MQITFFKELEKAQNIVIAGAGGGYDVFCGLPLYFWLKNAGKNVWLANIHLKELDDCDAEQPVPFLYRVTAKTKSNFIYFPELYLAQWLTQLYGDTAIYSIVQNPARVILTAYEYICDQVKPDTIILTDGGTDLLMRGDEAGLGTPYEDISHLCAVNQLQNIERKFATCIGFGIDSFHGVCHAHFLENVAALIKAGGHLGTFSLDKESREFKQYKEAYDYADKNTAAYPSIVNSSINSAILGEFGNHHTTGRTNGSELFINPLMALYWTFSLEHVANQNLYINYIANARSLQDFTFMVTSLRKPYPELRQRRTIPV